MFNDTLNTQLVELEQELQKIKSAADYLDGLVAVQQKNGQLLDTMQASYEEALRNFQQQAEELNRNARQLSGGLLDDFGKQLAAGSKQFATGSEQLLAGSEAVKQAADSIATQMESTRQAYETSVGKVFELHRASVEQWMQQGERFKALTDHCRATLDGTETLLRTLQSVNFTGRLDEITQLVQDNLSEQRRFIETTSHQQAQLLNHLKWLGWGIAGGVAMVGLLVVIMWFF